MSSPERSLYSVTGSIGADDIMARVILDKKNNSIHIHFHGKLFGNSQKPIVVKHADTKFPDDEDVDLVKQIVVGELADEHFQDNSPPICNASFSLILSRIRRDTGGAKLFLID